jgi:hypothetical protein
MFEDLTSTEFRNISEDDKRALKLARMIAAIIKGEKSCVSMRAINTIKDSLSRESSAAGDIHIFDGGSLEREFARYDARIAAEATS